MWSLTTLVEICGSSECTCVPKTMDNIFFRRLFLDINISSFLDIHSTPTPMYQTAQFDNRKVNLNLKILSPVLGRRVHGIL